MTNSIPEEPKYPLFKLNGACEQMMKRRTYVHSAHLPQILRLMYGDTICSRRWSKTKNFQNATPQRATRQQHHSQKSQKKECVQ